MSSFEERQGGRDRTGYGERFKKKEIEGEDLGTRRRRKRRRWRGDGMKCRGERGALKRGPERQRQQETQGVTR